MNPNDTGYPSNNFSSREAYDKVVAGLKDSVGRVVVVVKPECVGGFRGGEISSDNFEDRYNLGVLADEPVFGGETRGTFLPMDAHYSGDLLGLGRPERRDAGVDFHCISPERLEILADGSGVGTRGAIRFYTTEKAVAHCFDLLFPAVDYIRMVDVLGGEVSDELRGANSEAIDERKQEVMGEIETIVRRTSSSGLRAEDRLELRGLYGEACEWGLRDDLSPLDLGRGISVDVGEYVKLTGPIELV